MVKTMNVTQTRSKLTSIDQVLGDKESTLQVTKSGKPYLALMTWELYEAIGETLSICSDPELMEQLRQSIKDVQEGKTIPLDEIERELL